jgi:hypothetical protein
VALQELEHVGLVHAGEAAGRQCEQHMRVCPGRRPCLAFPPRRERGRRPLAAGDRTGGQREHTAALRLADEIGYKEGQTRAHDGFGHCLQAGGAIDQAREHWQQALALFTELGMPEGTRSAGSLLPWATADR